jgi:UDP-2,3-diacylglucosamine pyrophosphatase LpxH
VIGERLLRRALDELAQAPDGERPTVRVALLHHPLDWLRDFERDAAESLLIENVDFILHGHLHAQRPGVVRGTEGQAAILVTGAAYQGRQWPSCAFLVELDEREARVEAIAFQDVGRGIWMRDPILAPRQGGVLRIPRAGPREHGSL